MAKWNENFEKMKSAAKDAAKKVKESEAVNKIMDTTAEMAQKIKENETVADVAEKINQNEHMKKIYQSKHSKLIKIGAIALAVVLVCSLLSAIFGGRQAKIAEEAMTKEIVPALEKNINYSNIKFESDFVAKNSGEDLYLFDTTLTYTRVEKDYEEKVFYIVYSVGKGGARVRSFSYEDDKRDEVKEKALDALKKGEGAPRKN